MTFNEDEIYHDNDIYCHENHRCTNCKYEKILFGEEPCDICIRIHEHDRLCKWKPKFETMEELI